jgi:LytS/YehU family sensor histidine kinase
MNNKTLYRTEIKDMFENDKSHIELNVLNTISSAIVFEKQNKFSK